MENREGIEPSHPLLQSGLLPENRFKEPRALGIWTAAPSGVQDWRPSFLRRGAGAGDGDRTRSLELGKLVLYHLSYTRVTSLRCGDRESNPDLEAGNLKFYP